MRVSLVMVTGGGGGIQQSVIPYTKALQREGHIVQAVVPDDSLLLDEIESVGALVSPVKWGNHRLFRIPQSIEIRKHLKSFGPDGVIGFAQMGYPQARRAWGKRTPILCRCGSVSPVIIKKFLKSEGVIVTSQEMKRVVLDTGRAKVFVLPNFLVDPPRTHRTPSQKTLRIGGIGRLHTSKGFDVLIDAVNVLVRRGHKLNLVIAGSGPEERALKSQADALGLPVEFPGWIDNAEKQKFFDDIDIFVCPSRKEAFGFVFIEAMQAGLPVIGTDTVGAREIFTPGCDAIIVPGDDVDALAGGIDELVGDESLRTRIANDAQDTFARRFHIDHAAPILSSILTDAVSAPGG
jgi:glycosyltransferase involved in cell wall biosynthesis